MKIVTDIKKSWLWKDAQGIEVEYTDPLEFQTAHAEQSPIVFVSPKPPVRKLEKSLY
jgi:hypothetical protein